YLILHSLYSALRRQRAAVPHATFEFDRSPSSFHFILLQRPSLKLRPVPAARRAAAAVRRAVADARRTAPYHRLNSDFLSAKEGYTSSLMSADHCSCALLSHVPVCSLLLGSR
ncbi:hypothetical protein PIB30_078366, partial [Stylosanthes scabra]|nr:hypothetical protein [Stylosanthes scabra]